MTKKQSETAVKILQSLNDFLLGDELDFKRMPREKVSKFLEKHQLDADKVYKNAKDALSLARGKLELERANEKRRRLENDAGQKKSLLRARVGSLLAQIEQLAGSQVSAAYARKFEKATEEDLRTLLDDFDLLDQLDFKDDG